MENGSERKHLQLDRSSIRLPTISEDAQSALEQLHGLAYEAAKKMEFLSHFLSFSCILIVKREKAFS